MSKYCQCDKPAEEQAVDLQLADGCVTCHKPFVPCTACEGKGFVLANVQSSGKLEIQRCDSCSKYVNDHQATIACYELAREKWNED